MDMIEDDINDIIMKANRGKGSNFNNKGDLKTLSKSLNLKLTALQDLNAPFSATQLPKEVKKITTKFGHLGVNVFEVNTNTTKYLIDTGTELDKISHIIPDIVLITHKHYDHSQFASEFSCPKVFPGELTPPFSDEIITYDVSGHYTPSIAYFFPKLSHPVCFMGDALFKRSMGGCSSPEAYKKAINNVNNVLNTLPEETILCVGHGPCTTVAAEKKENPFFLV